MGGRGSSNPGSRNGANGNGTSNGANNGARIKRVNAQTVNTWAEEHENSAMTYALNPPDSITVGGVKFNNITGSEAIKQVGARSNEYTTNYQADIQASNGEWPVVQVTVTEKSRRTRSGTVKTYTINKQQTKLW